jgi:colanic acid/amylovoran biosynthesis glycosyltransferase
MNQNKRLRVAFIVGKFPCTTETFIINQIIGLLNENIDVKIIALNKSNEEVSSDFEKYKLNQKTDYLDIPKKKIKRVKKGLRIFLRIFLKNPLNALRLVNIIKYKKVAISLNPLFVGDYFLKNKKEFDIIHCHFGQRGIYGSFLKDIKVPGKLVVSFYGGDLSSFVKENGKKIYDPLMANGDLFLPLSENFKKIWIDLGGDEKKTIVHHAPTNLDKFKLKSKKNKFPIILTIARLVEKKGHKYFLSALQTIIKKNPNTKYLIIGDGPLEEELVNQVKELKIEKNVDFLGSVSPDLLSKYYNKSDIYVLPSVTASDGDIEGTPVSIMEAQASGLPVISTFHSGIPEIIKDKQTGFLVKERDVEDLIEKTNVLIKNPDLREKMGKQGRKFVMDNYNHTSLSKKLVKMYKRLLN